MIYSFSITSFCLECECDVERKMFAHAQTVLSSANARRRFSCSLALTGITLD